MLDMHLLAKARSHTAAKDLSERVFAVLLALDWEWASVWQRLAIVRVPSSVLEGVMGDCRFEVS